MKMSIRCALTARSLLKELIRLEITTACLIIPFNGSFASCLDPLRGRAEGGAHAVCALGCMESFL